MTKPWNILCGDALTLLKTLPDESVQCCVTSPPYYNLRDYSTAHWEGGDAECDHKNHASAPKGKSDSHSPNQPARQGMLKPYKDKCRRCGAKRVDQQMGLEKTPEEYVQRLVGVFNEIKRVLRKDGCAWLVLGDSFANAGGPCTNKKNTGQQAVVDAENMPTTSRTVPVGLKSKDLIGIPWRVAFALQDAGWYLRCDIIWHKINSLPESVTDRPTRSHEYVFLLTKSPIYFYDSYAIREQSKKTDSPSAPLSRNKRSIFAINTKPFKAAHFATMPVELALTCVKAGTSEKGCCPKCRAPWQRTLEKRALQSNTNLPPPGKTAELEGKVHFGQNTRRNATNSTFNNNPGKRPPAPITIGWQSTCACNAGDPIPCTVLDPFAGAATTGVAALQYGQHFLGIELNPAYIEIAEQRLQDEQKQLMGGPPTSKQRQPIANAPAKPWYEK
jgi:DNA modification methylase